MRDHRAKRAQRAICERSTTSRKLLPIEWLGTAAALPGRSLHVALALLNEAVHAKSLHVDLSNLSTQKFAVKRNSKYRALQALEQAGLIAVKRKLGRSPVVTILDPSGEQDDQA